MSLGASADDIARALRQAERLRTEVQRREKLIGRRAQRVARVLAELMGDGESFHRIGVAVEAFEVDGKICLAASYLDEVGRKYRHRYAVLYGGETALHALRKAHTASVEDDQDDHLLPPRFHLASYVEYEDFIYRLPKYVGDLVRHYEEGIKHAEESDRKLQHASRLLGRIARATKLITKPQAGADKRAPSTK